MIHTDGIQTVANAPVFTPAEGADPERVAAYQLGLARLKPACSHCGRTLGKREQTNGRGRCAKRDDCRLRQIFAGPKHVGGKGLCLAEVHERRRLIEKVAA
jgi:hypothetical protein